MLNRILIAASIIGALLLFFKLIRRLQLRAIRGTYKITPNENQLLYFSSAACSQCLTQEKILQQVFEEPTFTDIILKKYSIEKNSALARQWKVITLPTTILLSKQGDINKFNNGLISATTLRSQISALKK